MGNAGVDAGQAQMAGEEELIRLRAYHLWEAEGRPAFRELDHWYQAKEEVACKALGTARYKASQQGSIVTITATGVLPRQGMRASLESNRLEPDDPDNAGAFPGYMLLFRQVGTMGPAIDVPFQVTAYFEHGGSASKVLIFDRYGPHEVKVVRTRQSVTKPVKSVSVSKARVRKPARNRFS